MRSDPSALDSANTKRFRPVDRQRCEGSSIRSRDENPLRRSPHERQRGQESPSGSETNRDREPICLRQSAQHSRDRALKESQRMAPPKGNRRCRRHQNKANNCRTSHASRSRRLDCPIMNSSHRRHAFEFCGPRLRTRSPGALCCPHPRNTESCETKQRPFPNGSNT